MHAFTTIIDGQQHRSVYTSIAALQREFTSIDYQALAKAMREPAGIHATSLPDNRVISITRCELIKVTRRGAGKGALNNRFQKRV